MDSIKRVSLGSFMIWFISFATMFMSSLMISYSHDLGAPREWNLFLASLTLTLSYLITLIVYYKYIKNKDFNKIQIKKDLEFKQLIWSIVAVLINILIVVIIATLFAPKAMDNTHGTTSQVVNYTGFFRLYVSILYPVIFAPVLEEAIYRGLAMSVFKVDQYTDKLSLAAYYIVPGLIFASLHFEISDNWWVQVSSILFPFIGALIYSFIYRKTNNIIYPIITHSLYNVLVLIMMNTQ